MNQFNMSNMEIEEFCEALVLDYIRKYNAPTDYIDIMLLNIAMRYPSLFCPDCLML